MGGGGACRGGAHVCGRVLGGLASLQVELVCEIDAWRCPIHIPCG